VNVVDNLESLDDLENEDGGRSFAAVAIVGSAVAAGVAAYFLRRARHHENPEPVVVVNPKAWDRARELAFGDERAQAYRDFLVERVLPELKPALLGILEEVEEMVDDGFRRVEKSIRSM
jgi:hypothetical protein